MEMERSRWGLGDEQATLSKVREHLSEMHQELNIKPKGQLLRYKLIMDMLKAKFNPEFGLGSALAGDYHKGLSVICFAPYTPTELSAHRTKREAQQMSSANRRYEEAKEIINKKGKAPPSTYENVCAMVEGFWGFVTTYFGEDSNIAVDYSRVHQLLGEMKDTHYDVEAVNWRVITWVMINEARQHFNTIVTEENLLQRRGLPVSNVTPVMIHLNTWKHLPDVRGMPAEWYGQNNYQREREAKRGDRYKRKRDWDNQSTDEEEERWNYPGGSEWYNQSDEEDYGRQAEENRRGMILHEETNPQVQEMMQDYYKQYNFIMGGAICIKAGVKLEDLGIGNACLSYILGKCTKKGCTKTRWHPRAFDASPEEVESLCDKLKRGVDAMTRPKRRRKW